MDNKIEGLLHRFVEVERLLGETQTLEDKKAYRELAREHAYLSQIKTLQEVRVALQRQLSDNRELLQTETDQELIALLREEIPKLEESLTETTKKLENILVPPGPDDDRNTILELRAGTGGDEAALFVGDCVRMYQLYAAEKGWRVECLSATESERGGFKEYIMVLSGPQVYRLLQYEAGTHRVQRVPDTEAQGRVHTSAITVAVLLEPDEEHDFVIEEKDLRIDTYRASGAGGQHVNRTDSAVRITHLPTGVVVQCQDEKSQHKNKERAMRLLKARIVTAERERKQAEQASKRSQQVGSGDRSERIRTYNFPQNRLTDHRIGLTLYALNRIMDGHMDEVVLALVKAAASDEPFSAKAES